MALVCYKVYYKRLKLCCGCVRFMFVIFVDEKIESKVVVFVSTGIDQDEWNYFLEWIYE